VDEEVKALGVFVLTVIGAVFATALYVIGKIIDDYFKGR
jgi:hypothetical protein